MNRNCKVNMSQNGNFRPESAGCLQSKARARKGLKNKARNGPKNRPDPLLLFFIDFGSSFDSDQ